MQSLAGTPSLHSQAPPARADFQDRPASWTRDARPRALLPAACHVLAANSMEHATEGGQTHTRHDFSATITQQDLVDSYLFPFQACVEKGKVSGREQQIGGSGESLEPPGPLLEPPGPLLMHLHTVFMAYSECRPTRLNPLAERTCFSQAGCSRQSSPG